MEKENPEILRVLDLTRRLEQMNREIERLLARLPLSHHRDVARLNQLINEQTRLTNAPPRRALPPRVASFTTTPGTKPASCANDTTTRS